MAKSYFAILEVTSSASPAEVRSAYRRLAKAFHPDYFDGDRLAFQQIQEAYSVLGNPDKRKAYEQTMAERRAPPIRPPSYAAAEPLIPENGPVVPGVISPVRSFETLFPSFDDIFDWFQGLLFS